MTKPVTTCYPDSMNNKKTKRKTNKFSCLFEGSVIFTDHVPECYNSSIESKKLTTTKRSI
tara:strand:- start:254 stop:433 length:180 start_codon:yes stop_codon:yes gene_type:complete